MNRLPDWEERLTAVLTKSFARPFRYGEFDCCLFACECVHAMTGVDWAAHLRGTYHNKIAAGVAVRRLASGDVEAVATSFAVKHDIQEIAPSLARRGDVMLTDRPEGPALAVCVGEQATLPDINGLAFVDITDCRRAWRIS